MPTPTHDFSRPIPPGTVRISVIHSGDSFTVDLPSAKLGDTIQAFEDQVGPLTPDLCAAAAAEAADDGDSYLVTAAGLWLFLFQPVEGEINSERLAEMVASHGSALLAAQACEATGQWTFSLFAMPRWPASVSPYPATQRDRRRRWK